MLWEFKHAKQAISSNVYVTLYNIDRQHECTRYTNRFKNIIDCFRRIIYLSLPNSSALNSREARRTYFLKSTCTIWTSNVLHSIKHKSYPFSHPPPPVLPPNSPTLRNMIFYIWKNFYALKFISMYRNIFPRFEEKKICI